jgi:hypothetical protein
MFNNKIVKNNILLDIRKLKKTTKNMQIEDLKEEIKKFTKHEKNN